MKRCSKCGTEKPASGFYRVGTSYRAECKQCVNAREYQKRQINTEYERQRSAANKERRWKENPHHMAVLARAATQRRRARKRLCFIADEPWETTLARTNGRCAYCPSTENLTLDHIVPLCRGGQHAPGNLQAACAACNSSKGGRQVFSGHGEAGQVGLDWLMSRWEAYQTKT